MDLERLKNKKYNEKKLKEFGFKKLKNGWLYTEDIMNGDFCLYVNISLSGDVSTELIDAETNDKYTLHLVDSAEGKFVGKIRSEYESILDKIIKYCYEISVFEWEYTNKIIDYALTKYNTPPEYLWEKFPRNAVCRRSDNNKWYFALLSVKQDRLGFEGEDIIEIIDLRVKKDEIQNLLKQENIYPAYHMNKKSWVTVILDGSMQLEEIYSMIDESYELASKK